MAVQLSPGVNVTEFDLTTIVPAVGTTVGAIGGIFSWGPVRQPILISTESNLVNTFGTPNSNNYQTWFTASSFLGYGSALYVSRGANTTSGDANAALNAIANTGPVANIYNLVVLNQQNFENTVSFDANAMFIGKYPGALGNSLRVSVCDSVNAYSSNVSLVANADVSANFNIAIGSNVAYINVTSVSANVTAANAFATALVSAFASGDQVVAGNSTIGTQFLQLNTLTNSSNSSQASLTLSMLNRSQFATNVAANATSVQRFWQYQNYIGTPPVQTKSVSKVNSNTAAVDGMHIVVIDNYGVVTGVPGTVLETYTNVSRATDSTTTGGITNYWKTVVNQQSPYVWAVNDRPDHNANSGLSNTILASTDMQPLTLNFSGGQDGASEGTAALSTITTAYDQFASKEAITISLVLNGRPIGGTQLSPDGTTTVNNFQLTNYLISNLVSVRKDCVLFVTPDDGILTSNQNAIAQALVEWRSVIQSSSYAVMDSGYKYMYDRYNDVNRWVPTNGDIAGLCVYTDTVRHSWWSPAGFIRGQLKNVIKMRWNPRQPDRDLLYVNSINPVLAFPNQGVILYGDKTLLAQPSAFDRINVRRLFIELETAIAIAANYSLFELNDAFTRASFVNLVTPYLRGVESARGIHDFEVICDTTNNTPQVIDSNQFVGDIYIKPARSINFIQLNFIAVPTGVAFSEVIGQF